MASVVTVIYKLIEKRKFDEAAATVAAWQEVKCIEVTPFGGEECKILGTVLHIARVKKVKVSTETGSGDKKQRRDLPYYRIVFVRLVAMSILFDVFLLMI